MNLRESLDMLDYFINKYINLPNRGFFHRHGSAGKQAAHALLLDWQREKERLYLREKMEMPVALQGVKRCVSELMASATLNGNYFQHSLKTYLLAYHDALEALSKNPLAGLSMDDYFNIHFGAVRSFQDPIYIKDDYEQKAGLQRQEPSFIEKYGEFLGYRQML